MNIKVDFDNIVVKEDKNDFNVKILMLKGEKGDGAGATKTSELQNDSGFITNQVNDLANYYKKTETYNKTEVDGLLGDKVDNSDLNNYYEASEVDELLSNKANTSALSDYYKKTETYSQNELNSLLNNKANTTDIDTINSTLLNKANASDVANTYETKTSHDASISNLSSQISSLASGSPLVASSISGMTDTTRTYVNTTDGNWYYYNGSSWVSGGVYQGTSLSDGVVTYNKLENMLKKQNFVELHAEDLLWKKNVSCYQGFYTGDAGYITSVPFILPKGNTISIDSTLFTRRITYYDLDFNYIGNTGSFATQTTAWSYSDNCIVIISLGGVSGSTIELNQVTNERVVFTGLIDKISYDFGKSLTAKPLTQMGGTRFYVTEPFYLEKGSKISLTPDLLKKNSVNQNGFMYFGIAEENNTKDISAGANTLRNGYYTATQSGMVRLSIAFYYTDDMSSTYFNKLATFLKIEKTEYIPDNELVVGYSTGNANINYRYDNSGNMYLTLSEDFVIHKYGTTLYYFTMSTLEELFPTYIETIDNIKYLRIPANNMLYYDLNSKELKMGSLTSKSIMYGENSIKLVINKYGNFCGGILLEYILKQKTENFIYDNDMFNSHAYNDYDWKTIVKGYNKLYNNKSTNINSFLFFTDPHLMGSNNSLNEKTLIKYFNPLEKVYNSIPLDFICCGGDWLNDGDIQDEACFKLGYLTGFMNSKFKNYYPILGNHDTNYLGKLNEEAESNTGLLSNDTLTNLMFNKFGNLYYSFKIKNTNYYVLDNGTNWWNNMNEHRWEQIDWLANKLIEDNPIHSTILLHILWYDSSNVGAMTQPLTQLINAFNTHTTITLNNILYDFTNNTGHVDYVLSGHTHYDYSETINNVLCIATDKFERGTGTYDIIINDYDNNKLIMYRVGSGESREFDI